MKKALALLFLTPSMMAMTCSDPDVIPLMLTCTSQTTSVTPAGFGTADTQIGCSGAYAELVYNAGGVIASVHADVAARANAASTLGTASIQGGDLPGPVAIFSEATYQFTVPAADPGITSVQVEIRNYGRALNTDSGAVNLAITGAGISQSFDSITDPGQRTLKLDLTPGSTYNLTLTTSGTYELETTDNSAVALNVSVKTRSSALSL